MRAVAKLELPFEFVAALFLNDPDEASLATGELDPGAGTDDLHLLDRAR